MEKKQAKEDEKNVDPHKMVKWWGGWERNGIGDTM